MSPHQFLTPRPSGLNLSATPSLEGFTRHVCQNLKFLTGNQSMSWIKCQWNMFKNNSVYWWREQAKKCDWRFWKSCKKPCFLRVCFLSRPSFYLCIHSSNQQSNHPSIHRSLPLRKIAWSFWKFYLLICSRSISANSAHLSFPWIPLRCSVWPIVSLESRWQWKKKGQRLVISQRLRFLIIIRYSTWQQKCLLFKLLPSIVMVSCYALTYGYYGT